MLIINNLQLPVSNNMGVYQSVIESAKFALLSMENLLNGVAQRVQNGAFLLGLSTWHIYPDMVVHGSTTKSIKQDDSLIPEGSVITLGLQDDAEFNQGIYWSLPLAHLHFYGDPVQSSRSTAYDASRVSVHHLVYVALGALFNGWFYTSRDTPRGLQWLHDLFEFFDRAKLKIPDRTTEHARLQRLTDQPGWLGMLMRTAVAISQPSESERAKANKLIATGFRRYKEMLGKSRSRKLPYFGLLNPQILIPILKTDEDRISLLRKYATKQGLTGISHIIRYNRTSSKKGNLRFFHKVEKVSTIEFATVDPLPSQNTSPLSRRSPSNLEQKVYRHKRWIALNWDHDAEDQRDATERGLLKRLKSKKYAVCRCQDGCSSQCLCKGFSDGCLRECSCGGKEGTCKTPSHAVDEFEERVMSIRDLGEDCIEEHPRLFLDFYRLCVRTDSVAIRSISEELHDDMKKIYQEIWDSKPFRKKKIWHLRDGPWVDPDQNKKAPLHLSFCYGDPETAALYSVSKSPFQAKVEEEGERVAEEEIQRLFRADAVDALSLEKYLSELQKSATGFKEGYNQCIVSLKALASMMTVYESLPEATVALRVAESPLHDCLFIQNHLRQEQNPLHPLNRRISVKSPSKSFNPWLHELDLASKFSCIALCEFGIHQVDPSVLLHVFAMSSRNSIFVAAPLLEDPGRHNQDLEITRVVGNIGRAGIALLIPPQLPRIRSTETDSWEQVNHAPFDGKPADSFQNTSLHLSFTQYTLPINTGTHGAQDTETFLIESPISVYDRERWVADVDVLALFRSELYSTYQRDCSHPPDEDCHGDMVAVDHWEELLDREKLVYVVRAYQNPQARLATAIVSTRQGHRTVVAHGEACWPCIEKRFNSGGITFIQ